MVVGPLNARVPGLCDEVTGQVGAHTGGQVRQLRRRLDEPLRGAVADRLKGGKSTLVNALIGRRVARAAAVVAAPFADADSAQAVAGPARVALVAHRGFYLLAQSVRGEAMGS
jgi:hypothetical protein